MIQNFRNKLKLNNHGKNNYNSKKISEKGGFSDDSKRIAKKITKENKELRAALKAILEGELALKEGKTRSFREFLKAKFPGYAKNL